MSYKQRAEQAAEQAALRRAPEVEPPEPPSDPARVAAAVAKIANVRRHFPIRSPAQRCIENIERIVAKREGQISSAQKHMVAHCLRMLGTSTTLDVEVAA